MSRRSAANYARAAPGRLGRYRLTNGRGDLPRVDDQGLRGRDLHAVARGPLPEPTFPDPAPNTYAVGGKAKVELSCEFHLITPIFNNLFPGQGREAVGERAIHDPRWRHQRHPGLDRRADPGPTATPTPPPTATPTPTPTATPTGCAGATPTPTATLPPVNVSFYGVGRGSDTFGGGPPGSNGENQIVGIPGLVVDFTNTTTGTQVSCQWSFGDGGTATGCGGVTTHTYSSTTRRTYNVTLTVNGTALVRSTYVLIGCQVPSFTGVASNKASKTWTDAGFAGGNITIAAGPDQGTARTRSTPRRWPAARSTRPADAPAPRSRWARDARVAPTSTLRPGPRRIRPAPTRPAPDHLRRRRLRSSDLPVQHRRRELAAGRPTCRRGPDGGQRQGPRDPERHRDHARSPLRTASRSVSRTRACRPRHS